MHQAPGAFVIPNAWDAGSARVLEALGFQALATTSAGYAFSAGKRDSTGGLTRSELLTNAEAINAATSLPVSADLEDGFGAAPEVCADTIRMAADLGLAGGSIEDATGDPAHPIYDFGLAVDRIAAASEAARDSGFVLTARAENHINGLSSFDDTLRRLHAYAAAGADVVFAPGLPGLDTIAQTCAEVACPVNVLMGLSGPRYAVDELAKAGAKRISVGGSFARAAWGAFIRAATEVRDHGTFDYAADAIPDAEIAALMAPTPLTKRT